MSLIKMFLEEFEMEAVSTRKMLSVIPNDKYDWRPHPKSMTIRELSTHIADIPSWIAIGLTTDELDFAVNPYNPPKIDSTEALLEYYEKNLAFGRSQLIEENEVKLQDNWTMRSGDQIWMVYTKAQVIRHSLCQIIHHRAQLGVFLRLLDVAIPGCYGPSADDKC